MTQNSNGKFTTLPEPIKSGRNAAFYPTLLVSSQPVDDIEDVLKLDRFPKGSTIAPVNDRHNQVEGVCDVWPPYPYTNKLARYRLHPDHGWLEEVTQVWTIVGDYPTMAGVEETLKTLKDQGTFNITSVMRFGVQLAAIILGNSDGVIWREVVGMLRKMIENSDDSYPMGIIDDLLYRAAYRKTGESDDRSI